MEVKDEFDYRSHTNAPLGIRNNNPGNIRPGDKWLGLIGENKGFIVFVNIVWGIRALLMDLTNKHLKGDTSIRAVLTRYAPASENNTEKYILAVAKYTGLDSEKPYDLSRENIVKVAMAICLHENGQAAKQYVGPLLITDCISMMPLKLQKILK